MCGIALLVDRTPDGVCPSRLARMTAALARRGPDDEAYVLGDWNGGDAVLRGGSGTTPGPALPLLPEFGGAADGRRWSVGIGVRRLAVRDPGPIARQPMSDRTGRWLAYNGELYGVDALRASLAARGHRFRGRGDAEVLLAAWGEWGPDALARLSGMWAFVVWDAPRRRLWCARDALGIKPLYFTSAGGVSPAAGLFAAASTPGAIVAALGVRPELDGPAIAEYLATGLLDHDASTCLAGIRRLGAGCLLEITGAGVSERRWAPPETAASTAAEAPEARLRRFHAALDRAVATHLESDRPIGATLSGGLDSGSIVLSAAAGPAAASSLPLFTAGFAEPGFDERKAAAAIAARTPFPLDVVDVGAPAGATLADDVSHFLDGLDEPVVSASVYAQWCVMRRVAARGVTVILDGQGADELLCGYPGLVGPALADDVLGGSPRRAWAALDARADRGEGSRAALAARGAVALLPHPIAVAAGRLVARPTAALHPDLAARWRAAAPAMPHGSGTRAGRGRRLATARARLLAVHLPALLRYLDTSAMAWSVEARVPFLDREVVEAGLALEGSDLWHDGWQKWVLRDPRVSRLPDAIRLASRKRAFTAPEAAWWRGPLRTWLHDVLAAPTVARQGLLAPAAVAHALDRLEATGEAPAALWRWANVTWWMRR